MNKKKILIVMCVLAVIYIIFMIFIGKNISGNQNKNPGNKEPNVQKEYKYLTVGDFALWGFSTDGWEDLEKDKISKDLLNVYINNNYYGKFKLKYINSWNLYSSDGSYVPYTGDLVAFSETLNTTITEFNKNSITDIELNEINYLLNSRITAENLSTAELVQVDLDKNGILDKVVNVSNLKAGEFQEQYFNLCYVVLNNEQTVLFKELIDAESVHEYPIYSIKNILNINNEFKDSIILSKKYFSNSGEPTYSMYQYITNEYRKVV